MERTLSQEDRIRRAEEIYYRRQNAMNLPRTTTVNINPKKNYRLLKKVIVQIIACILIYMVIYQLQTNTDGFSTDSIQYLKGAMAYDIDFKKAFDETKKYMSSLNLIDIEAKPEEEKQEENIVTENVEMENTEEVNTIDENQNVEENTVIPEETATLSQMEQDAQYIKSNFSLIKPVEAPVTSRFGLRNPTTPTVPKNHTGIDLGVPEGTVIIASMEGTVEQVSSIGDYGNHIKITNGDVCTLYAHCKTIYVKEGDKISQGQAIGESGSSGNVTGPHLHFEIRRNNEYVDPDLILSF